MATELTPRGNVVPDNLHSPPIQASQDDMLNILVQLFWICLAILESDYEHEFLLGLRLLERVLDRLPLDRPDVTEKLDKLKARRIFEGAKTLESTMLCLTFAVTI